VTSQSLIRMESKNKSRKVWPEQRFIYLKISCNMQVISTSYWMALVVDRWNIIIKHANLCFIKQLCNGVLLTLNLYIRYIDKYGTRTVSRGLVSHEHEGRLSGWLERWKTNYKVLIGPRVSHRYMQMSVTWILLVLIELLN